jgi:catechol 2,3-dioxygenase-like lactoylglutathione lyase family enzyme
MIDHVSIGVKDIAKARKLYDVALATLGYKPLSEGDGFVGYGAEGPRFWVALAERPIKADEKSGLHICFVAKSRRDVDAFHAAALKAGGKDNGKPGLRPNYGDNYYAAFVTDADGYRVEAYCGQP